MDAVRALFSKGLVLGGELIQSKGVKLDVCKPCLKGKQTRSPILKNSGISNSRVLFRIFSDVCRPMQTEMYHGFRYYILHLDGNSYYLDLQLMKTKDESFRHARFFIERVEVVTGYWVNLYRSDGGGEYGSHEFRNYLELKGIYHEITNAYTPQENGAAERENRVIMNMARSILSDAQLPNSFWGDAVVYTAYILNRIPSRATDECLTPYQLYTGNIPNISHIRIFGCKAYVHIPDEKRRKLDVKLLEYIFLGYASNCKAFRLIHRSSGCIIESRNVHFDEDSSVAPSHVELEIETTTVPDEKPAVKPKELKPIPKAIEEPKEVKVEQFTKQELDLEDFSNLPSLGDVTVSEDESDDEDGKYHTPPSMPAIHAITKAKSYSRTPPSPYPTLIPPPEVRRLTHIWNPPMRDNDPIYKVSSYKGKNKAQPSAEMAVSEPQIVELTENGTTNDEVKANKATLGSEPRTFEKAMAHPEAAEWKEAAAEEMRMFVKKKLFEEVTRPKNRRVVGCKWVFKEKRGSDSEIQKYKARLVACGFTQIPGVDFTETFASVTKFTSIRILLALAAIHDYEIYQMDIKSAFLNGVLNKEIYMDSPPGYPAPNGKVWRLRKSLYGLKQASRE